MTHAAHIILHRCGLAAFLALLAALAVSGPAHALLEWTVYTDPSELRSISLTEGTVWAAGRGGLVALDRTSGAASVLTMADGLPTNDLNAVLALPPGDEIWIGTAGEGLLRYRPGDASPWRRWQTFPQGIASDFFHCLLAGGDGRIWYGGDGGLGLLEDGQPADIWTTDHGLTNPNVYSLAMSTDTLLVGSGEGLFRLLAGDSLAPDVGGPPGRIDALAMAADSVWALSAGSVQHRAASGGAWSTLALPLEGYDAQALVTGEGDLILTLGGVGDPDDESDFVWRYAPATGTWTDLSAGLPTDSPQHLNQRDYLALAVSPDGEVWLGGRINNSTGPGLLQRDGADWREHRLDDTPLGPNVTALRLAPSGRLWMASTIGGAYREDGAWTRVYPRDALDGQPFWSLDVLEDHEGWIWLLGWAAPFGRFQLPGGEPDELVHEHRHLIQAEEDSEGNRWFLSDGYDAASAIDIYDKDGVWRDISEGLPGNSAFDMAFLPDGRAAILFKGPGLRVWDTNGTLFDFEDDTWYTPGPEPCDTCIHDLSGYLASDTQFSKISAGPGGGLWIGQADGLLRIEPSGEAFRVASRLGRKTFLSNGLIGTRVLNVAASPDGSAWVGTLLGLARTRYDAGGGGWSVENWTDESGREAANQDAGGELFTPEALVPLPSHEVKQLAVSLDGKTVWLGTAGGVARVELFADPLPPAEAVLTAWLYPNPVRLNLGHDAVRLGGIDSPVVASIYNLEGQLVANPGLVEAGEPLWDLRTRFGNLAVSGVYLVRLEDRGQVAVKKIVLLR